jgi:hypothetical protein
MLDCTVIYILLIIEQNWYVSPEKSLRQYAALHDRIPLFFICFTGKRLEFWSAAVIVNFVSAVVFWHKMEKIKESNMYLLTQ